MRDQMPDKSEGKRRLLRECVEHTQAMHPPETQDAAWESEAGDITCPECHVLRRKLAQARKELAALRRAACAVMPYLWDVDSGGDAPYCECCGVPYDEPHDDDCKTDTLRRLAGIILTKRGWNLEENP